MKYPLRWLRTFVNPTLDDTALAQLLTMSGLEVEAVEHYGNADKNIVVAEIVAIAPHPQADRLRVCTVSVGASTPLTIVCGAPNVVVGMKAPLAKIGAIIGGKAIGAANLRGVASSGMLCSASELGLVGINAPDGLWPLPQDAPIGIALCDYLPTADTLLTIKLTPNRGDCLSIYGMAREISALTGTTMNAPTINPVEPQHANRTLPINLSAKTACPLYCGAEITQVHLKSPDGSALASPWWMQLRLAQCGERVISPLVDMTNFVLLEYGQPLHAFDRTKLQGPIGVRLAKAGENLVLLNDTKAELTEHTLIITDNDRPVAMAGVMGGADTMIDENSHSVFFEAAHFAPDAIQGMAKHFGIPSEAAYRFERGVDGALPRIALARAIGLTIDLFGGSMVGINVTETMHPTASPITLRLSRARSLMGYDYTNSEVEISLSRLGFGVDNHSDETYHVRPPSWRFDIEREEDLIEEVARLVGYDAVPESLPEAVTTISLEDDSALTPLSVMKKLAAMGYSETQHFGFVSGDTDANFSDNRHYHPIRLTNPIAENLSTMRSNLMGSLVEHCAKEARNHCDSLRTFELSRVFQMHPQPGKADINPATLHSIHSAMGQYHQPYHLAMLIWGSAAPLQWGSAKRMVDIFDIKGDFENLWSEQSLVWQNPEADKAHSALHPTRQARLIFDNQPIGWAGELHPTLTHQFGLAHAPMLLECDFSAIAKIHAFTYQPISRIPVITRDLSLRMDSGLSVGDIVETLRVAKIPYLLNTVVFDVYLGDNTSLPVSAIEGANIREKSVAFRFYLQNPERSMTEAEIVQSMKMISDLLSKRFSAVVR